MAQDGRSQRVGEYGERFFILIVDVCMYLSMVALGPRYCLDIFLAGESQLLVAVAPLVVQHRL